MSEIQVHEDVYEGYAWRPTKPLTLHQMAIGDLMASGCRPQFIRAIHEWLKAGRSSVMLLHAETPAEATVLSLLLRFLDREREQKKNQIDVQGIARAIPSP